MSSSKPLKNTTQLVWGAALMAVGIAVFFRIPQVVPKLVELGMSAASVGFARICFYLIGCMLVGGGANKIIQSIREKRVSVDGEASAPEGHGSDR